MEKKRRCESYFGLHFDFHSRGDRPVGDDLRYDVIAKLLDEVKPDYVQIDTKGHPGFSSYPTRVGHPAPDMRGDQVRMWRELTEERGIALYGHHSGLFDMTVAAKHPEWAVVDENGAVSTGYLSVFGGYADGFLIPQLLELALDRKLDGAWVDGECWGVKLDYSEAAVRAWAKVSSVRPPKPGEEGFEDYLEFIRGGFRAYVKHYIEAVKAKAPDFQLTSNWMYSAYMPEKPTVPIDFMSGDYSPKNSVNSARLNGRFLACQNLPWDLMAWGHNSEGMWQTENRSTKEAVQHCQEAAFILALGGGFQFYNIQYGQGSTVQEWAIPIWKETADFVRAREPFLKGARLVPQVGIFLPSEAHRAGLTVPFASWSPSMNAAKGLIQLAQDSGYSSEILETHQLLENDLSAYGAILLGRIAALDESSKAKLEKYVEDGGSLLLASPQSAAAFGFEIGEIADRLIHIRGGNALAPIQTLSADFAGQYGAVGSYYLDNYMENGPFPAAVLEKRGKGTVIALGFDAGTVYPTNRTNCMKDFFRAQMKRLFPNPAVELSGSEYAEFTLLERENELLVNLLNYGGPHDVAGVRSYNEVPALGPLHVKLNLSFTPKQIILEPSHTVWNGSTDEIVVDRLDLHTVIRIIR